MVTDALIIFDRVRHTVRDHRQRVHRRATPARPTTRPSPPSTRSARRFARRRRSSLIDSHAYLGEIVPRSNMTPRGVQGRRAIAPRSTSARATSSRSCSPSGSRPTTRATRWTSTARCDPINPSPYMFCLDLGDSAMVGSSPEVHVRGEDGRAELRPIAGTRPRSEDPAKDDRLARGTAGRSQGARRAHHAGGPRAQRPRARLQIRQRAACRS